MREERGERSSRVGRLERREGETEERERRERELMTDCHQLAFSTDILKLTRSEPTWQGSWPVSQSFLWTRCIVYLSETKADIPNTDIALLGIPLIKSNNEKKICYYLIY
jgi:hypothetical protein